MGVDVLSDAAGVFVGGVLVLIGMSWAWLGAKALATLRTDRRRTRESR
ncbi:MAG: hypothetical protein ACRD1V_17920 [Vicinamibacterales bacterium]